TLSSHLLEVSIRSAMLPEEQPISVGGDTLLNPHVGKVGCRDLVAKPLVAELVVQQPVVLGFSHWYKLEIIAIGIDCLMFHAEIGRLYDCNLVVWKGEFTKILFMCLCALFEHLQERAGFRTVFLQDPNVHGDSFTGDRGEIQLFVMKYTHRKVDVVDIDRIVGRPVLGRSTIPLFGLCESSV